MQFDPQMSEQDLLSAIHQATLDVAATSAHVERRLQEARLGLGALRHAEAPPIGDAVQAPRA
jgi:hypothetical protein